MGAMTRMKVAGTLTLWYHCKHALALGQTLPLTRLLTVSLKKLVSSPTLNLLPLQTPLS